MNEDLIRQKFNAAQQAGLNFAAIRLPQTNHIYFFYATKTPALQRVNYAPKNTPVFYCSPYSAGNRAYTLMPDAVYCNNDLIHGQMPSQQMPLVGWHSSTNSTNFIASEDFYIDYVNNTIAQITADKFDKAVAARCVKLPVSSSINMADVFNKACVNYPDACVFFYSLAGLGTWFGASPEKLLSVNNTLLETTAIAGTKPTNDDQPWGQKEQEEQAMIAFFIDELLAKYALGKVKISDVETIEAGNVKHLCSKFTVKTNEALLTQKFHKLLNELNPTPAVCGLPQMEASLHIAQHENLERRFYSGFVGLELPQSNMQLYVNLRSMELLHNSFAQSESITILYAGAGITAQSNARQEFIETEKKLQTMISLFST